MRRQFSEKELVDLTAAAVAINAWNRLAIAFRATPQVKAPRSRPSRDQPIRFSPLRVLLPALDVDVGAARDHLDRLVVERADGARRRADDQRIVGEALAFGDQRAGADQGVLADLEPLSRIAPMPIRLLSPTMQPCSMTLWPITQLRRSPSEIPDRCAAWNCPGSASARRSRSIRCRRAAPRRTRCWNRLFIRTRPISTAVSATQ